MSYSTDRKIGYVRVSLLRNDKFSKNYQLRVLDDENCTDIIVDNGVCLNFKESALDRLKRVGVLDQLTSHTTLVMTCMSRVFANTDRLLEFHKWARERDVKLKCLEQLIGCPERLTFLDVLQLKKEAASVCREEVRRQSTQGITNNGRRGKRLITCYLVAHTLQNTTMSTTQVAKSLDIRREWIYNNRLHIASVQNKYLALTKEQLSLNDPLLKREILQEIGL